MIHQKKHLFAAIILMTPNIITAQEVTKKSFLENNFQESVTLLIVIALLVVLLALYMVLKALIYLLAKDTLGEKAAENYSLFPKIKLPLGNISHTLTNAVAIENERDILLDHDYDGIKELDNHLPPWWKWMFYATIIWAIGYFSYYYVLGIGLNQYEKYDTNVAEANIKKAEYLAKTADNVDENTVILLSGAAQLASGKKTFSTFCVPCHGDFAEGKIGPNLTDNFWIHGGTIKDVFTTIKYGVANKMIPWQEQLLPSEINEVASYVLSLQGSNPPNAMAPQGEIYDANAKPIAADSSTIQ